MKKIEQTLLSMFRSRNNFKYGVDKISVDDETKSIFYYNYGYLVFAKTIKADNKEIVYFCLPSFDRYLSNTTKSRVNTFLYEYGFCIQQKNYKYFCNDIDVKLDTIYFINKNDDGKYYIDGGKLC